MGTNQKILRHLPTFMQDGPNLIDFTGAVATELEIAITNLNNTKDKIQFSTSTGIYLDAIGKLLDVSRNTDEIDDDYKIRISTKFNLSASSGTIPELKNVIIALTGIASENITITEVKTGVVLIEAYIGSDQELLETLYESIEDAKASGIYIVVKATTSFTDLLTFTDDVTPVELDDTKIYGLFTYGDSLSTY